MLQELCTIIGAIVLTIMVSAIVWIIAENITYKIKQRKKIIKLDQYENITYKGIEYKIMSKKIKVRRIEHKPLKTNERQIKGKNKYYDYY